MKKLNKKGLVLAFVDVYKRQVLDSGHDVAFFECRNYQVKDQILKIVNNAFEKGYADTDIQVLAPMYSGVSGIDGLNPVSYTHLLC